MDSAAAAEATTEAHANTTGDDSPAKPATGFLTTVTGEDAIFGANSDSSEDNTWDEYILQEEDAEEEEQEESSSDEEAEEQEPVLKSGDLEGLVDYIRTKKPRFVIVMAGAGMSTAAGIPDFRSPGSGLYENLQRFNLPRPEDMFDLDYFRQHPEPFFAFARELWPTGGKYQPTKAHHFVKVLEDEGLLMRCYTQNIDHLEYFAGVSDRRVITAHGNFKRARTLEGQEVPIDEARKAYMDGLEGCKALSEKYGGLVKPDIVFFKQSLPANYYRNISLDFPVCDLLFVIGTSLQVRPFSDMITKVPPNCPRVLINRDPAGLAKLAGSHGGFGNDDDNHRICGGFRFGPDARRDVFLQGQCDQRVEELCERLGWDKKLQQRIRTPIQAAVAEGPAGPARTPELRAEWGTAAAGAASAAAAAAAAGAAAAGAAAAGASPADEAAPPPAPPPSQEAASQGEVLRLRSWRSRSRRRSPSRSWSRSRSRRGRTRRRPRGGRGGERRAGSGRRSRGARHRGRHARRRRSRPRRVGRSPGRSRGRRGRQGSRAGGRHGDPRPRQSSPQRRPHHRQGGSARWRSRSDRSRGRRAADPRDRRGSPRRARARWRSGAHSAPRSPSQRAWSARSGGAERGGRRRAAEAPSRQAPLGRRRSTSGSYDHDNYQGRRGRRRSRPQNRNPSGSRPRSSFQCRSRSRGAVLREATR